MSSLPTRLVAIQARIPTGESCEGCEFVSFVPYDSAGVASTREACGEPYLAMYGCVRTDGQRLPACRERDGYAVYPPGSGVPELVEAAKVYTVAPSLRSRRLMAHPLQVAARKVAGEAGK